MARFLSGDAHGDGSGRKERFLILRTGANRRRFLALSGTASAAFALGCSPISANQEQPPPDWPEWSPDLAAHYIRIGKLKAQARDLRSFGVRADGDADDTEAFRRAVASGAEALILPPGAGIRLTGTVGMSRPVALLADESSAPIIWNGTANDIFHIEPAGRGLNDFVDGQIFDGIVVRAADGQLAGGRLIAAFNVRNLSVTRCRTDRVNLCFVGHLRQLTGLYVWKEETKGADPAVVAGFSESDDRDLNDNILVADNRVDFGEYAGMVLRFHFASHVTVFRNRGLHANVSWWGGGAKRNYGGEIEYRRRVRHCFIADNVFTGCNGGVYGNNGQYVTVARNDISDMTDVGVDFEGCFDCIAYDNTVRTIGNFGLATFFAARNIVFERNRVEQNGEGANLHVRFGKGKIGGSKGVNLIGMRSAGFSGDDAIQVIFRNNSFAWTGAEGSGSCLPSYFGSLTIENNLFDNVTCDLRYRRTGILRIAGNRMRISKPQGEPLTLIAGSARDVTIAGNSIDCSAALPTGSQAIVRSMNNGIERTEITGNTLTAAQGALGIDIETPRGLIDDRLIESNRNLPVSFAPPGKA